MFLPAYLKSDRTNSILFWTLSFVVGLSIFGAIILEEPLLVGTPAFLLLVYLTIVDFKMVYFILVACLPLSMEYSFPNGFGTDLPTEPLMVGLMLVFVLYILQKKRSGISAAFLVHPITLLLMLHVGWIFITTITSSLLLVSVKFLLAKLWYVVVFYFMTALIVRNEKLQKMVFWTFFIPLIFTVVVTLLRHSTYGFSFADVYRVLHPFYRNHVAYAGIMATFFPVAYLALGWYTRYSTPWWMILGGIMLLVPAIYLSYTRAAYFAVVLAAMAYWLFNWRLIKWVIALALIGAVSLVVFLVHNNKYLDYAPNYETTIAHTDFNNLIEATYNFEDISTMERVHRWVAGGRMFIDQPILGYGPGNFVNFYRPYTVTGFQTYVSSNEEQSGIHSYFLMTLVEQGIVGLILFLALSFYLLIKGEEIYHASSDKHNKRMVMMALLSIIVINAFLIINDMLETDKIGPLYFIMLALIVHVDLKNKVSGETLHSLKHEGREKPG